MTEFTVDSFKVYPSTYPAGPNIGTCTPEADGSRSAVIRAEQAGIVNLNRVIAINFQDAMGLDGSVSISADYTFWTGHVVVAVNGNFGGPPPLGSGTVMAPAVAHGVLGVGMVDIQTLALDPDQSRGPSPDGRIKPDIQAVTNVQAPTIDWMAGPGPTFQVKIFDGTSAATPIAAGAAALFDAWLHSWAGPTLQDPGQVYSLMLLSGPRIYPNFDNDFGVGLINMPAGDGNIAVARLWVQPGETAEVQIPVDPTQTSKIDAAIWWPEWYVPFPPGLAPNLHRNINLHLINPDGALAHESVSGPSVFERSGAIWTPTPGEGPPPGAAFWTVRMDSVNGMNAPRMVYLAVWERQ